MKENHPQRRKVPKPDLELEFRRGYYIAVANLIRLHSSETEARETLAQYGHFNPKGIDEMDLKLLRPLAKAIARLKGKLN